MSTQDQMEQRLRDLQARVRVTSMLCPIHGERFTRIPGEERTDYPADQFRRISSMVTCTLCSLDGQQTPLLFATEPV